MAYRTLTISQSVFATRFTNWHFSLPNKLNLAFFKAFGNENYHSVLSCEKHGNRVPSVIEISKIGCMGHFNALKRQNGKSYKKLREKGHCVPSAIRWNANGEPKTHVALSSDTAG